MIRRALGSSTRHTGGGFVPLYGTKDALTRMGGRRTELVRRMAGGSAAGSGPAELVPQTVSEGLSTLILKEILRCVFLEGSRSLAWRAVDDKTKKRS